MSSLKRVSQAGERHDCGLNQVFRVDDSPETDYRFSLANERTYLAWIRTALALIAGGVGAAKAIDFHHEWARWLIAAPPIFAGGLISLEAAARWCSYEHAMRTARRLPVGRRLKLIAVALFACALVALAGAIFDH